MAVSVSISRGVTWTSLLCIRSAPRRRGSPPAAGGGRSRELSAVLGAGGILTAISQVSIVPLLPDLPRLTGASASNVSWLLTVTLLVGAVVTPLFGRAGDIFGKRRMLLIALGMLTTGSILCALTSNIWLLIPARGLQGACLAVVPLSISILRDELPPERVGSAVALMSATVGIGAALGVPFASLIIEFADWHVMFWVTGGLGLADLILAALLVRESKVRTPARFDIPGAVGLALGLLCLLLALSKVADWGFTSPRFGVLTLAAVVILAGWTRWQLRVAEPLVDLRLARRPAVLAPNVAALLIGFSFYANSLSTAQLVQVPTETGYGLGLSVFASGLCLLPGGVAMFALSPVAARITASRGPRTTLLLGASAVHQREPVDDRGGGGGGRSWDGAGLLGHADADHECGSPHPDGRGQRPQRPAAHGRAGVVQRRGRRAAQPPHDDDLGGGGAEPRRLPDRLRDGRRGRGARPRGGLSGARPGPCRRSHAQAGRWPAADRRHRPRGRRANGRAGASAAATPGCAPVSPARQGRQGDDHGVTAAQRRWCGETVMPGGLDGAGMGTVRRR
ncbi:MFS transporter [Candidatus Frankia alpina]|uniref:MFS transporter n=1 Tax=Candidatus Frankia alpina TaxID=2699483 RepID=UPI001F1BCA1F|nr:MFS transporter [Candidatus Frankia alpina]